MIRPAGGPAPLFLTLPSSRPTREPRRRPARPITVAMRDSVSRRATGSSISAAMTLDRNASWVRTSRSWKELTFDETVECTRSTTAATTLTITAFAAPIPATSACEREASPAASITSSIVQTVSPSPAATQNRLTSSAKRLLKRLAM